MLAVVVAVRIKLIPLLMVVLAEMVAVVLVAVVRLRHHIQEQLEQ